MTADAVDAGLEVRHRELELEHRATGRDLAGFLHRGRQLRDIVLAFGPQRRNHRGSAAAARRLDRRGRAARAAARRRDRRRRRPVERGGARLPRAPPRRAHDRHAQARRASPSTGSGERARSPARLLVGLAANMLNQLDTKPGRALKAYLLARRVPLARCAARAATAAVLLAPYDLREMAMLGDSGSNTLGAVLGLRSVSKFTERQRWSAIAALAGLTLLGERRSLGKLIEQTPVFRELDCAGEATR